MGAVDDSGSGSGDMWCIDGERFVVYWKDEGTVVVCASIYEPRRSAYDIGARKRGGCCRKWSIPL